MAKREKKSIEPMTLLFIILPIVALVLGYFGTGFMLKMSNPFTDAKSDTQKEVKGDQAGPISQDSDDNKSIEALTSETGEPSANQVPSINPPIEKTDEDVQATSDVQIMLAPPTWTLYSIQLGSFASYDNAQKKVAELKHEAIPARTVSVTTHKIMSVGLFDKESLEKLRGLYTDHLADHFIATTDIRPKIVEVSTVTSRDQALEVIGLLGDVHRAHAAFYGQAHFNKLKLSALQAFAKEQLVAVEDIQQVSSALSKGQDKDLFAGLLAYVDAHHTYYEGQSALESVSLMGVWQGYIDLLFNYSEVF